MAFRLSRPRGRQRQPGCCPRCNAGPFFPYFRQRHERVFRAPTREHDLHDERHDHAALSASRSAGRLLRPVQSFSGDGFPGMEFTLRAVSNDAFDDWARGVRGGAGMLDANAYAELAKQSMNVKPFTYGAIDHHLFQAIVTQAIPPAPGPQGGHPTPDVWSPPGD